MPLVTEVPTRTPSRYVAKERDNSIRAFRDQVIASIGVKNIVDVRSPAEFAGELAAPAHYKRAAKLRATFLVQKIFLGQRLQMKMAHLNQMMN